MNYTWQVLLLRPCRWGRYCGQRVCRPMSVCLSVRSCISTTTSLTAYATLVSWSTADWPCLITSLRSVGLANISFVSCDRWLEHSLKQLPRPYYMRSCLVASTTVMRCFTVSRTTCSGVCSRSRTRRRAIWLTPDCMKSSLCCLWLLLGFPLTTMQ